VKKGFKSAWSSLKNSKTGMFGLILVLLINSLSSFIAGRLAKK